MPLSKQAKLLYETALRRKGLQPGKAVRQDPRTFVGPIETYQRSVPASRNWWGENSLNFEDVQAPRNTYWNHQGRFQDLEDELSAAIDAGIWERKNPVGYQYYRYYNDGDIPSVIKDYPSQGGYSYPYDLKYYIPRYRNGHKSGRDVFLTRLGELELEARADEMIENDYKDYLKKMYQRFPNRAAVREQFPAEYNAMPYLEDLFPEE